MPFPRRMVVAVAVAALAVPSVFAESRHRGMTRSHDSGRSSNRSFQRDSHSGRSFTRSFERGSTSRAPRADSRRFESRDFSSRGFGSRRESTQRFTSRSDQRSAPRRYESYPDNRSVGRNRGFSGNRGFSDQRFRLNNERVFRDGRRFFGEGRVSRIVPYRGGYNVFLDGWGYPYFVPFSRFRLFPFRIGLFIRFGAFFDPFGFYSVYDVGVPPYPYSYPAYTAVQPSFDRYDRATTNNDLQGIVESIDDQGGTMIVRDDNSRELVTVNLPNDRSIDQIRPGDHVDFSGDWRGRTQFVADRLEGYDLRR